MLEDAIQYPWRGEQHVERLTIGGLLTFLGILFVPLLFVYGYLVRVLREAGAEGTDLPPSFDDWGQLLVDGVVAFGIAVVYFAVPTVLLSVGWVLSFVPILLGAGIGGDGGVAAGGLVGVLVMLGVFGLGAALFLVAGYLLPGAVATYARTDDLGAAFSPSTLRPVVTDKAYAVAWLVAFVVNLVVSVLVNLAVLTIVGILAVPFLNFYGQVACTYAIGIGVAEAERGSGSSGDGAAAGRPAV